MNRLVRVARPVGLFVALLVLAVSPAARADERILEYGSEVRILADGHLDVTETLRIRAEGRAIRRGITRDFPTRYRDRFGNRVVVDFDVVEVLRDGRPEAFFTESIPNGVRINTGDDSLLATPTVYTWTLRYRTNRQLGFFAGHDELYWNAIGPAWEFPVDRAWARVTLPAPVAADAFRLDCYTGQFGSRERSCSARVLAPDQVEFLLQEPLPSFAGLTTVVGFPKGLVTPPARVQRAGWFLRDNAGVLVGLIGLCGLLGFYVWRWHLVGRDPPAGPLFPHYEPPEGFSAGELRVLSRMGHDTRAFAADVVQMAVRGALEIRVEGKEWRLVWRPDADPGALSPAQRAIAAALFAGGVNEVLLVDTQAERVGGARSAQAKAIADALVPAYYVTNGGSLGIGVLFSIAVGLVALVVGGDHGLPLVILVIGLMIVAHALFAAWLRAPTAKGRRLMDGIAGLRLYLSVAESAELAAAPLPGQAGRGEPALDAARYEALLPYALALDVDADWTRRFSDAVGVQEARAHQPAWYHGPATGTTLGTAGLGSQIGSTLTSQLASASSPPGSSSGGGGGGFSGGGGGGGGGGGR